MKTINILLVEDDQLDVTDVVRSLNKLNITYQLKHAKNGEEAIDILAGKDNLGFGTLPDILLIDINMPRMNGLELLEIIRKNQYWKNLRCFILTTSSEQVDRALANSLGVSGYITKPLRLNSPAGMDGFNLMIDLLNLKSGE